MLASLDEHQDWAAVAMGARVGEVGLCALSCPTLVVLAPLEVVRSCVVGVTPFEVGQCHCSPLEVQWAC